MAELLTHEVYLRPAVTQLTAREVLPRLQDRLEAARTLIDKELNDLVELRTDINRMSDALLLHILVLQNIRDNFLYW